MADETKKDELTRDDEFYKANAALAYFKNKLNPVLRKKDEWGFDNFHSGLTQVRKESPTPEDPRIPAFVQNSTYNKYLSQDEIKKALGEKEYQIYLNNLKTVTEAIKYRKDFDKTFVKGSNEDDDEITSLNYGRRFSSIPLTTSKVIETPKGKYVRKAVYNPKTGMSEIVEEGNINP